MEDNMYFYDFVIIFALQEEFEQFKNALSEYTGKKYGLPCFNSEIDDIITTPEGKSFSIFATTQVLNGMVSSAICATKHILEYKPQYIVLLGIAAGFDLPFGTVMIAEYVFAYQQGSLKDGKIIPDGHTYWADQNIMRNIRGVKGDIIQDVKTKVKKRYIDIEEGMVNGISAEIGGVATSIQVVEDKTQQTLILENNRRAIGIEMEGVGVFQAVAELQYREKPIPLLIKGVSDHADENKNDSKHPQARKLAAFTSAYFFLKFLELDDIQPLTDPVKKQSAKFVPLEYLKNESLFENLKNKKVLYKDLYKEIIRNTLKDGIVRFVSITAERDFAEKKNSVEDKSYIEDALKRNVKFYGVVVNPTGPEANFRNGIESPPRTEDPIPILNKGADNVKKALQTKWKKFEAYEDQIEIRYSQVGVQFKLWLSDDAAMIEPYHFGRENLTDTGGLCGFSQNHYMSTDREYKILKDHFDKLWEGSTLFWPPSKNKIKTMGHKKAAKRRRIAATAG
jgi:nucleoside phosphorylase